MTQWLWLSFSVSREIIIFLGYFKKKYFHEYMFDLV